VIFKIIPLIIPILIFIFIGLARSYLISKIFNKPKPKSNEMISCFTCGTYVHEDLIIRKYQKQYCSEECSNS